ncbi:hypothetical protein BaRGS_00011699 [Batillaria attramentaria]|uniref:LRAT domain-containing protein n=1 Tax=Batillaria attramentaria TaxID=370345 RepID=A0ABD0LCD8_9CAEN
MEVRDGVQRDELVEGDIVEFKNTEQHSHCGIYVGGGKVVHLKGQDKPAHQVAKVFIIGDRSYRGATIAKTGPWDTPNGRVLVRKNFDNNNLKPFQNDEIVRRANKLADNVDFVLSRVNGCKDFALGVRYGVFHSHDGVLVAAGDAPPIHGELVAAGIADVFKELIDSTKTKGK